MYRIMHIPKELLTKARRASHVEKTPVTIEKSWGYLVKNFETQQEYLAFLEGLPQDQFDDFIHTMFFYYAHDLYRVTPEGTDNIHGFMYQVTLSIAEYLIKRGHPKQKIKKFMSYFSPLALLEIKNAIVFSPTKNTVNLPKEPWEVLYDMRNEFIHGAEWFIMPDSKVDMVLGVPERRYKDSSGKWKSNRYMASASLKFPEYLEFFWEAYLNHFGHKRGARRALF